MALLLGSALFFSCKTLAIPYNISQFQKKKKSDLRARSFLKDQDFNLFIAKKYMKIGIVGLPNVGKSTLFNALTKSYAAPAENFPFCTIEPNVGIVDVKDPRMIALSEMSKTQKIVYAHTEFVDIAGLVKGASKGEGLGNKFLSHIREVDAIVQVLRHFQDTDIVHVE